MKHSEAVKNYREISDMDYERCLRNLLREGNGALGQIETEHASELDGRRIDFRLKLHPAGLDKPVRLLVETNPLPRPSQYSFSELGKQYREAYPNESVIPVLAAPYISERIAGLCREHGWGWYDLSGNCRIKVPNSIYIERTGFKAIYKQPRPIANLSTAASARVLRALLAPQNAGRVWTQTKLKAHCGGHDSKVSFGLVNKVVRHLNDQSWLSKRDDGFTISDPVGLLETWSEAYRFDRHRRINFFTLLKPNVLAERLEELNSAMGEAMYAAFSAADHQAPSVRQNKTWLFVNDVALDRFTTITETKRVDSGENVVVLVPDDDGVFYLGDAGMGGRLACTNPIQTWLDLRHVGGRGAEAAEAIMNQCLKPAWEGGGNDV